MRRSPSIESTSKTGWMNRNGNTGKTPTLSADYGDIYLEKNDLTQAENTYREALAQHVDESLFLDRMLQLAEKYEESGDFKKALELLIPLQEKDSSAH